MYITETEEKLGRSDIVLCCAPAVGDVLEAGRGDQYGVLRTAGAEVKSPHYLLAAVRCEQETEGWAQFPRRRRVAGVEDHRIVEITTTRKSFQ